VISHRSRMACVESYIATSRSGAAFRCMYHLSFTNLLSPSILRSHHEPKTAIPVSTVVGGTSQCGICERISPARHRRVNIFFSRIQILAELTDRNRNVLIPSFCANSTPFPSRSTYVTHRSTDQPHPLAPQTTKCGHSTKKKQRSSAC
jgi:hypothetical protein